MKCNKQIEEWDKGMKENKNKTIKWRQNYDR